MDEGRTAAVVEVLGSVSTEGLRPCARKAVLGPRLTGAGVRSPTAFTHHVVRPILGPRDGRAAAAGDRPRPSIRNVRSEKVGAGPSRADQLGAARARMLRES
jgi:hypothetical protein